MNSKNEFPGSPSNHFVTVSPKPILVNRAIRPTGKKAGKIEEEKKERGKERTGEDRGEKKWSLGDIMKRKEELQINSKENNIVPRKIHTLDMKWRSYGDKLK